MHTPADCVQGIVLRPLADDLDEKKTEGALKLDKHHVQLLITQVPKTALSEPG